MYEELRRLAAYHLTNEKPGQTLQATALVHEAYLRLINEGRDSWQNRRHFFGAAAEAMRRILVEKARRKQRIKHGGHLKRTDIDEVDLRAGAASDELVCVDEALEELERLHPETAQLVKLRFFIGLSQEETAGVLGMSRRTVNARWVFARAWLFERLHPEKEAGSQLS